MMSLGRGNPNPNVSSTHGVEIPHPNPSPPGRRAKTLILRFLPLAQFGRGGWGVRAIKLTLTLGLPRRSFPREIPQNRQNCRG
jgi:hypothetical protein